MGRWIAYIASGLLATVIVLLVAAYLLLGQFDLSGIAAARASAAIGRPVAIAKLHVTPGWWTRIALEGVQIPNIPGGTQDNMVELKTLDAEVNAWSLLSGPAAIRRLDIDGLTVLLERVADGTPNWKPSEGSGDPPPPPATPPDRSFFPTLLDVAAHASAITIRTSKGHLLPIRIDDMTLHTTGPDAPVRLVITGAYHDVPTTLTADLQSIARLRQSDQPYGTDLRFKSNDTALQFDGTMTRPLSINGATGRLTLHAPELKTLSAIMGSPTEIPGALDIAGTLTRNDALWDLTNATGTVSGSPLAPSSLRLQDGGRTHPDHITLDLAFERLELDKLLPPPSRGQGQSASPGGLTPSRNPDPQFKAKLTAQRVTYHGMEGSDLRLAAAIEPGRIDLDDVALKAFGAAFQGAAHAEAADKGARLTAEAAAQGVDVQQLRRAIGARDLPLTGRLDAQLTAEAAGGDISLETAHITAVMGMRSGAIARDVIEKASLDVRTLFRAPTGMVAVTCLLGVVDVRAGQGTISPLRIRTAAGTIAGQGRFDIERKSIDVTVGSERATTSTFALDVPLRIYGPIADPTIRPSSARPALATADLNQLPPRLSQAARQNPCLTAR